MDPNLERAQLLINQGRHEMAEQQLRQLLAKQPHNATAHLLLSICLKIDKRYKEATKEAELAVGLEPDNSRGHLVLGNTFLLRDRYDQARQAFQEALRLDPYDEDVYSALASVCFQKKEWAAALSWAEQGLEIEPDNGACLSLRSLTLEKLGEGKVAVEAAHESLERNPDDPNAHATHGWALLNDGKHKLAQEAFREALRLDPTNQFARQGMINALNANNFLFRQVLRWYTFMSRLSGGIQWAIILGLFLGQQVLSSLSRTFPAIAPFVGPIVLAYFGFCIMTWIANPLFNTVLRFNRYGKYLLDDHQIRASNMMAAMFAFGLGLGIALAIAIPEEYLIMLCIGMGYAMFMQLPLTATFQCEEGRPFVIMAIVTLVLGVVGLAFIGLLFVDVFHTGLLRGFLIGNIASQFLGGYLMSVTQEK